MIPPFPSPVCVLLPPRFCEWGDNAWHWRRKEAADEPPVSSTHLPPDSEALLLGTLLDTGLVWQHQWNKGRGKRHAGTHSTEGHCQNKIYTKAAGLQGGYVRGGARGWSGEGGKMRTYKKGRGQRKGC